MSALNTAFVAAGSSLLTFFLAPWLQNYYWRKQRRDELRLAAIEVYNQLTTKYITNALFHMPSPGPEWMTRLNTAAGTIKALFPDEVYQAAKAIDPLIKQGTTAPSIANANTFAETRDVALCALYAQVLSQHWLSKVLRNVKGWWKRLVEAIQWGGPEER